MKKIINFILALVVAGFIYDSCSGSDSEKDQSVDYEEYEAENSGSMRSGKFQETTLNSPASLMGLLSGKTFKGQANGTMSFSGQGGTIEGYPFTITSMEVVNAKLGRVSIYVPSMRLDGNFVVMIGDDSIVLADKEAGNTFVYE